MKLDWMIALGAAVSVSAIAPTTAQPAAHTTTTVTKVHGPLKILPHHKHKICRTRWVHHRRTTKCWYH